MIPIRTDSRLRTTPWMNWAIIAANVLVFFAQQRFPSLTRQFELNPQNLRLLSFFTYALLHASPMHIAGNMLFLYIFGNNVNDKMGHLAYAAFYLAGGVVAGMFFSLFDVAPVIGASGAVSAVTGAYLVLFPRARVTLLYFFFFIGVIEIPSLWLIGFYFVSDLFLNFSSQGQGVAHMAHLGGSLFGVVLCYVLLSLHLLPRDHYDVVALVKQWNRRRQYRGLTAGGYDPFANSPSIRAEQRLAAPVDPRQERVQQIKSQISDLLSKSDLSKAAELYLEMKRVDPEQVLSRQAQLDVANQLASEQKYAQAAEAYEMFLRFYKNFEQIEQVELMLGLIYARYLSRYAQARECLIRAMARLHGERELSLARDELRRIEPYLV